MDSRVDNNCVFDGKSAVVSSSKTAAETSSTSSSLIEFPFGAIAMKRVSTQPVVMVKLVPM